MYFPAVDFFKRQSQVLKGQTDPDYTAENQMTWLFYLLHAKF